MFNTDTQQYETFQLIDENDLPFTQSNTKTLTNEDVDDINLWMYIREKFNISNQAWNELSMKSSDIPNTYKIKKRIEKINANWKLAPTPGEADGIQSSFKDSIKEQVKRLKDRGDFQDGNKIKIKLSGDGTNIGKRLKIVNFTYTILDEKEIAMNEQGNYILAIVKTTETYDNLRESLSDLRSEMAN